MNPDLPDPTYPHLDDERADSIREAQVDHDETHGLLRERPPFPTSDTAREAADNSMIGRYLQEFMETGKCGSVMASTVDFIPRLAALRREVEGLKAELASMTNESRNVPLCADHAETWFTARYFKPGDCWFCQGDKERDTALAQLAEATKERDEARARVETLKIKLVSLSDVLPEWSTADWEYAEGTNPRLIAGEFTFGDALALRAAIAAGGTEG